MIEINISGRGILNIENIVFDYNGTIAVDGVMSEKIKDGIRRLSEKFNIYILTADTYGNVKKQCEGLPVKVETFPNGNATEYKKQFIRNIGSSKTIAVGNGLNDIGMFKEATLAVAVIGEEGCSSKAIMNSDITNKNIEDVFNMILNTDRIIATLRD